MRCDVEHFFCCCFRFISLWLISISAISSSSRILSSVNIRCPARYIEYISFVRLLVFWVIIKWVFGLSCAVRALAYNAYNVVDETQTTPTSANRTKKEKKSEKREFVVRQRNKQITHSAQISNQVAGCLTRLGALDFSLSIILTNMFFSFCGIAFTEFFSGGFHCFCGTVLVNAVDCLHIK